MKLKTTLLIMLTIYISGCQPGNVRNAKKIDYSKIAGTWKAENSPWQIGISKKGQVKSAVFPMGEAIVKPNKTTFITMKDESKSSYRGGNFPLFYDPESGEMEITINMERIHVRFLDNEIIGKNETIISGRVSDDGKIWETTVFEMFDYGPRFPQAEEDIIGIPMKFIKVAD